MRWRLYRPKRSVAVGSPDSTTERDERMKRTSHARSRRPVTPLRSGPTRSPFPIVWQLLHWRENSSAGGGSVDVEAMPVTARMLRAMPITHRRAIRRASSTGAREGGSHLTFRRLWVNIEGGMFVQREVTRNR